MPEVLFTKYLWALGFLPGALLGLFAMLFVPFTHRRYSRLTTGKQITGGRAARTLLDRNGMANVELYQMNTTLADHHDPRRRCLFLSADSAFGTSVASVGMMAHVVGHAIQFKQDYGGLKLRQLVAGRTAMAVNGALLLVGLGLLFRGELERPLLLAGVGLFLLITLLQITTLPVEFDANRRVLRELSRHGLIEPTELSRMAGMLRGAAWTNVPPLVLAPYGFLVQLFVKRTGTGEDSL